MKCVRITLYIRLSPEWLSVRLVGGNRCWEDVPQAAIDAEDRIFAIGARATDAVRTRSGSSPVWTPFKHIEGSTEDFVLATAIVSYAVCHAAEIWRLNVLTFLSFIPIFKPTLICHPLSRVANPITPEETWRLGKAVGKGLFHQRLYVWVGSKLSDSMILSRQFPGDHWYRPGR